MILSKSVKLERFIRVHCCAWILLSVLGTNSFASESAQAISAPLSQTMAYVEDVLTGKLSRHAEVRDYLEPVFLDIDGRDRYLLNLVALIRRGGILNAKIRRMTWNINDRDDVYGYVEAEIRACGFWYLWIPRCVDIPTNWRRVDGRWYVLPPEKIRLDPEVRTFLRRL